jgi:hypothetical protein
VTLKDGHLMSDQLNQSQASSPSFEVNAGV